MIFISTLLNRSEKRWNPAHILLNFLEKLTSTKIWILQELLTSWTLLSSLFFQISTDLDKGWGKKCSTGQRLIFIEVTSYKIHNLMFDNESKFYMYSSLLSCLDLPLTQSLFLLDQLVLKRTARVLFIVLGFQEWTKLKSLHKMPSSEIGRFVCFWINRALVCMFHPIDRGVWNQWIK